MQERKLPDLNFEPSGLCKPPKFMKFTLIAREASAVSAWSLHVSAFKVCLLWLSLIGQLMTQEGAIGKSLFSFCAMASVVNSPLLPRVHIDGNLPFMSQSFITREKVGAT